MEAYKRNQVEGAVARCLGRTQDRHGAPNQALAIRLKRLIETDREQPLRSWGSERKLPYAFFDGPPPGSGAEVMYSPYSAWGLYLAVRLMDAGMPQREAVQFMREVRSELEVEHRRILSKAPEELIDHAPLRDLDREVREGLLVRTIDHMAFFVAPADIHAALMSVRTSSHRGHVCRTQEELRECIEAIAIFGAPMIVVELVNPTHRIAHWLNKIEPARRGRKS